MKIIDLFDLKHTIASAYLAQFTYPWEALSGIGEEILSLGEMLADEFKEIMPQVWVHQTAMLAPTAYIGAPAIIGAKTEIRHGAFIRAAALVGEGCVIGNSTELKNCILLSGVQVPPYNYVGDSVRGYKAHTGAGTICSNLKSDGKSVIIHADAEYSTGLRKVGAFLGDGADVGCGCVLNPGTVIGKNTSVYPLTLLRGAYPADSIVKSTHTVVRKK